MRRVDVVGAHGQLEAVDAIRDLNPAGARAIDAPGVLVGLLDRQLAPFAVVRPQAVDVALVLADQVAAGGPHRHAHVQAARVARLDGKLDLDAARFGLRNAERVRVGHRGRALYQLRATSTLPGRLGPRAMTTKRRYSLITLRGYSRTVPGILAALL